MEFETTAALLSQIIETTREPAETAGTAMKTIIARFTEMKKATSDLINIDGEEVSVNKVEAALKSAGVSLRDVNGEFRDLDDVFLELSSKWNGLDKMTQRYVATMAAGSRQQSRFIAMMSNYDRTMDLVNAAYDSAGASQDQFSKTQESLEAKINRLKNAWDEFLMGMANHDAIKFVVDLLTKTVNTLNLLTEGAGGAATAINRIATALIAFKTAGAAIKTGMFMAQQRASGGPKEGERSAKDVFKENWILRSRKDKDSNFLGLPKSAEEAGEIIARKIIEAANEI
jgi:TP901 family phage tail tape measure protein